MSLVCSEIVGDSFGLFCGYVSVACFHRLQECYSTCCSLFSDDNFADFWPHFFPNAHSWIYFWTSKSSSVQRAFATPSVAVISRLTCESLPSAIPSFPVLSALLSSMSLAHVLQILIPPWESPSMWGLVPEEELLQPLRPIRGPLAAGRRKILPVFSCSPLHAYCRTWCNLGFPVIRSIRFFTVPVSTCIYTDVTRSCSDLWFILTPLTFGGFVGITRQIVLP